MYLLSASHFNSIMSSPQSNSVRQAVIISYWWKTVAYKRQLLSSESLNKWWRLHLNSDVSDSFCITLLPYYEERLAKIYKCLLFSHFFASNVPWLSQRKKNHNWSQPSFAECDLLNYEVVMPKNWTCLVSTSKNISKLLIYFLYWNNQNRRSTLFFFKAMTICGFA